MRRAYISHEHRLIVYWSPKCGCTSVAYWFANGLLKLDRGDLDSRAALYRAGHMLKDRQLLTAPADYHSVAFTREPLSRAISAYVEKCVISKGRPLIVADELGKQADALLRQMGKDSAETGDYTGPSFLEFLEFIAGRIERRRDGEPRLNHHWNTQMGFGWAEQRRAIDRIVDLADLDAGLAELGRRYGFEYDVVRQNTTNYAADAGIDVTAVPSRVLAEAGVAPAPEQFITEQTVRLAAAAYAIDYDALGYAVPTVPPVEATRRS